MLPDPSRTRTLTVGSRCLNAPTGAWCSLTRRSHQDPLGLEGSQCTYRCVVLPDGCQRFLSGRPSCCLNAPTGAWCSLTTSMSQRSVRLSTSQCTYRCVVLPDTSSVASEVKRLLKSQCTYRCVVLPDGRTTADLLIPSKSQCTYRCVVLPDRNCGRCLDDQHDVSMHLQVRGAP